MSEHMKVILATRNRYFEYGLSCLLKKEQLIIARNFLFHLTVGMLLNMILNG